MEYIYKFEKMEVWKDARLYVKKIYEITALFPDKEKFGLCSQLQRAAISIPLILQKEFQDNLTKNKYGL